MPHTTTQHQTPIQLPKVADRPRPRGAVGRSWGGGGAAGPLVGSAGVGSGAGIAGRGATVGAPRGRQLTFYFYYYLFICKINLICSSIWIINLTELVQETSIKYYVL